MPGFFYHLGRMVGPKLRQANWVVSSLTGTEADAAKAEYQVGRDLAAAFVRQAQIDADPAVVQFLGDIAPRLAACVRNQELRFNVRAVRSPEVNALAFPGGFVFLMRPLLEFCNWDRDEIAFVIGHEMGHVLYRHAINRLMTSSLIRSGVGALPVGGVLRAPVLNVAATLLNQGYSQDQELEADNLGLQLVCAAGLDGRASVRLMQRLRTVPAEAWHLNSWFSSHPPAELRVQQMEKFLQSR